MSFDTLTPELQNILLVHHSYMTKWLVFLFIIFLSAFYIWEVWPNHKPTPFFTQAIMRGFFFVLAYSFLLASPIMVIGMSYELDFLDWYSLMLLLYKIFTSILMIVVFIDFFSLGIFYFLKKVGGLDASNGRVQDIIRAIENNKHFLKMSKKGGKKSGG